MDLLLVFLHLQVDWPRVPDAAAKSLGLAFPGLVFHPHPTVTLLATVDNPCFVPQKLKSG